MRRWIFVVVLGVLLAIAGVVWILQGLNLLGQSGGMNGQHIWALIGVICVIAGLGLAAAGVRGGDTGGQLPPARHPAARRPRHAAASRPPSAASSATSPDGRLTGMAGLAEPLLPAARPAWKPRA
jgi:hypothetical protein